MVALSLQQERLAPQGSVSSREDGAQSLQAFHGVKRMLFGASAVRPLVVSKQVNQRVPKSLKLAQALFEEGIGAGGITAFDVSVMHHKRQPRRIEFPDHIGEQVCALVLVVGSVADQGEFKSQVRMALDPRPVARVKFAATPVERPCSPRAQNSAKTPPYQDLKRLIACE